MNREKNKTLLALATCLFLSSPAFSFKAQNVFIIIADQFRYDESFGDKMHKYVPHLWNDMTKKGTHCMNFYGNPSFMIQVHLAFLTGSWNDVRRLEPKTYPDSPTIFEVYRKKLNKPVESCYFGTSKREYWYLEYSKNKDYGKNFKPYFEITQKEKDDNELYAKLFLRMKTQKPSLIVVILGGMQSYNKKRIETEMKCYREQMLKVDEGIYQLWNYIQSAEPYKDKTDLFLFNDHGDMITQQDCDDECKRYMVIFGIGPDIKENYVSTKKWKQTSIFHTTLKILGVEPTNPKEIMEDYLIK